MNALPIWLLSAHTAHLQETGSATCHLSVKIHFVGDIPPGIRDVICLMQHGTCRLFFCHSGEKKSEICSDPWNRCCVPNTEEEKRS
ncbi:sperm associated antigen 11 [Sus scrofa]|uniref:EP2E protein n=1 Tax=Sus scrofa TaxID=9823 RepID=Q1RLJ2_PIG|nr:sperm associated antigen 11 [Sus scrofa]DAA05759.1 TPA_exp: EP2E protein [Sus scrofa]